MRRSVDLPVSSVAAGLLACGRLSAELTAVRLLLGRHERERRCLPPTRSVLLSIGPFQTRLVNWPCTRGRMGKVMIPCDHFLPAAAHLPHSSGHLADFDIDRSLI